MSPPQIPPVATARLQLRRFASRGELQRALEQRLAQALAAPRGQAAGGQDQHAPAVMLSGGSTPIPAYQALAGRALNPARGLTVLFSDERYVPCDSDQSNYHQTRPLLDSLQLAPEQVLRVRTELPLAAAVEDAQRQLAALLQDGRRIGLGLLGLGADGHTASLFGPGDLSRAQGRLAIAVHRPDGRDAVSVTPALLRQVDELVFVVAGADKRTALAALVRGDPDLTAWRAVHDCAAVQVWADAAAAP